VTFGPGRRVFTAPTLAPRRIYTSETNPSLAADIVAGVSAGIDLWELARALVDNEVGVLVIGNGDHVTGVVSERDVVRAPGRAT
jgi:CBS domain-containing protein